LINGSAACVLRRNAASAVSSSGRPPLAASADWRAANGTGEGGGVVRATTARFITLTGGRGAGRADRTAKLSGRGATGAVIELTGVAAIACGDTGTTAFDTGCDVTKVCCDTAVTAPGTVRFTYFTLLIF